MRKLLGLLALSLALALCGCASDTEEPTVTDPTHIYEEVREDFLIDAEVVSFPGDGSVTIYEATPRKLTEEQISNFLSANGDAVTEWTNTYDPNRYFGYTADTALRGFVGHAVSKSRVYPGSFNYYNHSFVRWRDAQIYASQQHYDDSAQYAFAHLFMEPKDFTFDTAGEAEKKVRELLSLLGFDNLILHRTLYIDHEILADEVTPALRTDEWQSSTLEGIPTYDDWSADDDGYIFEYFTGVNSIPLFYRDVMGDITTYHGSAVQVWYQSSGIVFLYAISSLWDLGSPVETMSQLILASEALDIAQIKLENTKVYTDTIIDKISGEYIYVPSGDKLLLKPVWVVYANSTSTFTGITTRKCVVIDAVTGDELM